MPWYVNIRVYFKIRHAKVTSIPMQFFRIERFWTETVNAFNSTILKHLKQFNKSRLVFWAKYLEKWPVKEEDQ